jgi:hypothetical protein
MVSAMTHAPKQKRLRGQGKAGQSWIDG